MNETILILWQKKLNIVSDQSNASYDVGCKLVGSLVIQGW